MPLQIKKNMKLAYIILAVIFFSGHLSAQKKPAALNANLTSAKSTNNRIIWPQDLMANVNAKILLTDLDKFYPPNPAIQNRWISKNISKYIGKPEQIKQIFYFSGKIYADCKICKKDCKGECIPDSSSKCICLFKSPSYDPNLKEQKSDTLISFIFFSNEKMDDDAAIKLISKVTEKKTKAK